MTDAPEIFDGHAYCFPDVRKLMGFPSLEEQQIHVQKAIANHHVQPWRKSDHALGSTSTLMDATKWPSDDALKPPPKLDMPPKRLVVPEPGPNPMAPITSVGISISVKLNAMSVFFLYFKTSPLIAELTISMSLVNQTVLYLKSERVVSQNVILVNDCINEPFIFYFISWVACRLIWAIMVPDIKGYTRLSRILISRENEHVAFC